MAPARLTPIEQLEAALRPSPFLPAAHAQQAISLVHAIDKIVIVAVEQENLLSCQVNAAGSRSGGAGNQDHVANEIRRLERDRALRDPENQEDGFMPCIGGDVVHDRYTLVHELGRGESSKVWLAEEGLSSASGVAEEAEEETDGDGKTPSGLSTTGRSDALTPSRHGGPALRQVAVKIYRCEERLNDSMQYERGLLRYIGRRCLSFFNSNSDAAEASLGSSYSGLSATPSMANLRSVASFRSESAATAEQSVDLTAMTGAVPTNPADAAAIFGLCGLRDDFVLNGPHGSHPCLVFDVLGPPVDWLMKHFHFKGITHKFIVRDILHTTLVTLERLEALHVIHTDLKPENLLFARTNDALSTMLDKLAEKGSPGTLPPPPLHGQDVTSPEGYDFRVQFIDFGLSYLMPPELRSVKSANGKTRSSSSKIGAEERELLHLGNYQKGSIIQTREYRAPEILLGTHFNTKADVWSLGCMAYELVTGQFLFDPKAHPDSIDEDAMDHRHLYEISTILGAPPTRWLDKSKGIHTSRFFDPRTFKYIGQRKLKDAPSVSLTDRLLPFVQQYAPRSSPAAVKKEAALLSDFISKSLHWDAAERCSATQLLKHPWLTSPL